MEKRVDQEHQGPPVLQDSLGPEDSRDSMVTLDLRGPRAWRAVLDLLAPREILARREPMGSRVQEVCLVLLETLVAEDPQG